MLLERRSGNSGALIAGFRWALANNCSTVVTIDADGAHVASEIPFLLKAHEEARNALTIGNRFHANPNYAIPSSKVCANFFASRLINKYFGTSLDDVACGFRVLDERLMIALINISQGGYRIAYEAIAVCRNLGYPIGSAPASVRYNAIEPWVTRRQELIDLAQSIVDNIVYCPEVSHLAESVSQLNPVTIRIAERVVCMLPLREYDSYLLQFQDPVYVNEFTGKSIVF